jgi:hypothetical protein
MNRQNIYFLTLSVLTVLCLFGIGIAIGLRSLPGILVSILGVVGLMGVGFRKKKQLREENE